LVSPNLSWAASRFNLELNCPREDRSAQNSEEEEMEGFRTEKDSMGEVRVPFWAYYGAQTQRALENFPISRKRMPREMIRALGIVKRAAAEANMALGVLDQRLGRAIVHASQEVIDGLLDVEFVVDVFQTGSGTSTNMNANEVIANRACEILGGKRGSKDIVHPNDHVNMSQSSNDVIPTAIHVATAETIEAQLLPSLRRLERAFREKAVEFDDVIKLGRTHLQDALPVRLGQEFQAYASQVAHSISRIESSMPRILELALGGTAVGTGVNAPRGFASLAISRIGEITGLPFVQAPDLFEALASKEALVEMSGQLRALAVALMKIANDLRLMNSGPRGGLGEIILPALQPGSSIMPGKVNPVIPECVMMVAAAVMGNDLAIALGAQHGLLELNTMMPLIGDRILESINVLASSCNILASKCVMGIKANRERALSQVEGSLALVTPLAPALGYDMAASLAKEAWETGKSVRELLLERRIVPEEEVEELLDLRKLTGPGDPMENS
jgi:fumarate hydratase class II